MQVRDTPSDQISQQAHRNSKTWLHHNSTKLMFSVSGPRLDERLTELRDLNTDLQRLASQTIKLNNEAGILLCSVIGGQTTKRIEEHCIVGRASRQLYGALEKCCSVHAEHFAHFRLEQQRLEYVDSDSPTVRFDLAFSQGKDIKPSMWFAVHSITHEAGNRSGALSQSVTHENTVGVRKKLTDTLRNNPVKRNPSPPPLTALKKSKTMAKKSVRFKSSSASDSEAPSVFSLASFLSNPLLPDFCVRSEFCVQAQRWALQTIDNSNSCLGYLKKGESYKNVVFIVPSSTLRDTNSSVSLAQIMKDMVPSIRSPQYQRIRLAKQLASAVLQFHHTPLLDEAWRSEDVIFFRSKQYPSQQTEDFTAPYLNVRINGQHRTTLPKSGKFRKSSILNSHLHALGVMLLELAYQAPLASLRTEEDLRDGETHTDLDFDTARRLSQGLITDFGLSYAKVVRKCLNCDFGQGTADLEDPDLQAAFYNDVICKLDKLQNNFEQLHLD